MSEPRDAPSEPPKSIRSDFSSELPPKSSRRDPSSEPPPKSLGRRLSDWRHREIRLALGNAFKLGSSLLATWTIALLVRLYVPRFLGPERFGKLTFADAFTMTAFIVLSLGLDTYVRKEISVRPSHASDFMGGILGLRLLMLVVVFAGMEIVLHAMGTSVEIRQLVYVFGAAQFFMVGNTTSAGLLHAAGKVNELSVLSVVAKIIWGIGIVVAIVFRLDLWAYAGALALSEGLKSLVLFTLARKHLRFDLRIRPRATFVVIWASMPFYVTGLASTFYDRIGVSLLEFMSNDREVGWYGAAAGLAGLTMLFVPLISWVLIPLFARAAAASESELRSMIRRSLEFILILVIPVSLMLFVGADVWIAIVFGPAFAPAVTAMRILAVAHALMYVSVVCGYALAVLSFSWRMSSVFVGGMVVNLSCNMLLIDRGLQFAGSDGGGGGAACAMATLLTEIAIVIALLSLLGRRTFDAELVVRTAKNVAAATSVALLDTLLLRPLGPARLVVDLSAYTALVLITGAVDVRGMLSWTRTALRERRAQPVNPSPG